MFTYKLYVSFRTIYQLNVGGRNYGKKKKQIPGSAALLFFKKIFFRIAING